MKKSKTFLVLILLTISCCMMGCSDDKDTVTFQPARERTYPLKTHFLIDGVEYKSDYHYKIWYFIGTLPEPNFQALTKWDGNDSSCTYVGQHFTAVPLENTMRSDFFGWRLDCNYLAALGQTNSGDHLYGVKENGTYVTLLLVGEDVSEPRVVWYVSDKLDVLEFEDYTLNDFVVECLTDETVQQAEFETIWTCLNRDYGAVSGELLVESSDGRELMLVSKAHPWLICQINYCYPWHGGLYLYNIPGGDMVLLDENLELDYISPFASE